MRKNTYKSLVKEMLFTESKEGVFARGDKVVLKHIDDCEYEGYEEVLYENSILKNAFDDQEFMKYLWKDLRSDQSLNVSIYSGNKFCGYCGIKKVNTRSPEIMIELLKKFHGQGIGYSALSAFMAEYARIMGVDYFLSKVEADNMASVKLMKKLGGKPFGITSLVLKCEKEKAKLEEEFSHLIDEDLRKLANEWEVEPRKLLSHALVFRIDVNLQGGN